VQTAAPEGAPEQLALFNLFEAYLYPVPMPPPQRTKSAKATLRVGRSTIRYHVVRSAKRRRTLQITVDPDDGVVVAVPMRASWADINAFVRQKARWILKTVGQMREQGRRRGFVSGESLPYLGRPAKLVLEARPVAEVSVTLEGWRFHVAVPEVLRGRQRREAIVEAFKGWYMRHAFEPIANSVARWSQAMGLKASRVLVRDQRRRWASCARDATLRFNWRVALMEPKLIDYIVVHELAHIAVPNHSQKFWQRVAKYVPDFNARRAQLRQAGHLFRM
jgi:predicted metal-dependent hydrolase